MDEREAHPRERGEAVTPARVVGSGIEEFRGDFIVVTVTSKARRRVQAYEKPTPSAGIAESWPSRPTGLPALTENDRARARIRIRVRRRRHRQGHQSDEDRDSPRHGAPSFQALAEEGAIALRCGSPP